MDVLRLLHSLLKAASRTKSTQNQYPASSSRGSSGFIPAPPGFRAGEAAQNSNLLVIAAGILNARHRAAQIIWSLSAVFARTALLPSPT